MRKGFTRNIRLIERRKGVIEMLKKEGFYLDEIGLIVGIKAPAVSKIIKKAEHNKSRKKHHENIQGIQAIHRKGRRDGRRRKHERTIQVGGGNTRCDQ